MSVASWFKVAPEKRRCPICARWFAARRANTRACSPPCTFVDWSRKTGRVAKEGPRYATLRALGDYRDRLSGAAHALLDLMRRHGLPIEDTAEDLARAEREGMA